MLRNRSYFADRLVLVAVVITLVACLTACRKERDVNVTAKTSVSGNVNGGPIEVDVVATFDTGRGGSSTCKFTKLPTGFNPASLGSHT
jgi:hypothetical protein